MQRYKQLAVALRSLAERILFKLDVCEFRESCTIQDSAESREEDTEANIQFDKACKIGNNVDLVISILICDDLPYKHKRPTSEI